MDRFPLDVATVFLALAQGLNETVARQYPFQWLNLYPFWDEPT